MGYSRSKGANLSKRLVFQFRLYIKSTIQEEYKIFELQTSSPLKFPSERGSTIGNSINKDFDSRINANLVIERLAVIRLKSKRSNLFCVETAGPIGSQANAA